MDFIQMPSDYHLNKLIFFKESEYSEATKKTYWGLYLNYIADLEIKHEEDLGDFSQSIIDEYLQFIQNKSNQTINQTNAFINKYLEWYSKYYNVEQKKFNFSIERQNKNWYLSKKEFFKMCNKMVNNDTSITKIVPLLFARYGILGKEAIYMRRIKWSDIDHDNNNVLICDDKNNIITKIPVNEEFFNWINILKQYEKALYKGHKVVNNYIIKSQVEKEEIINYSSLNTKVYWAFDSIKEKRIAFNTLLNCAIVDYLYSIYKNKKLESNQELIEKILIFYPNENINLTKLSSIKSLYMEVTKNNNLNLMPSRKANTIIRKSYERKSKKDNILEEISVSNDEDLNEKDDFRNVVVKDADMFYIIVKRANINRNIRIDEDIIYKIQKYKWYLNINDSVVTRVKKKDTLEIVYLANFILGVNKYYKIGFKNDNKFDYRKENLIEL